MAGLKDKRGFIDKDRLDLSERKAVEFWMKRWGVTQDQLAAAHRKVGRMISDIGAELGQGPGLVGALQGTGRGGGPVPDPRRGIRRQVRRVSD